MFDISDLRSYVVEHRPELVRCALTIVRAWVVAGRPVPDGVREIGGFEAWSKTLSGILDFAGIDGFLDNLDDFYEQADEEDHEWAELLSAIFALYPEQPFTVKSLEDRLLNRDIEDLDELRMIYDALPDTDKERLDSSKSITRTLGNKFRLRRDRRFGIEGWQIVDAGKQQRTTNWKVCVKDPNAGK